jgi:RNA polymerase sigma factor (sigma-70 family)
MPTSQANAVLRYIENVAAAEGALTVADGELLQRFVPCRDEAAFAVLVRRHGPMVLRLGRRLLQNEHDAEDVFQATFLVLSRQAAALRTQQSLGAWLYGVAYRIAQKARISAARRRKYEPRADTARVADPLAEIAVREARMVLDQELARLPDKFRGPLVLCYLEGRTREEAARQLGWSPSMLKSRLEQARDRLRRRLASRGIALSGVLAASLVDGATASAAVPPMLLDSTVKAALVVAAGGPAASVVSAPVAALAEGVMKTMFLSKLRIVLVLAVVLAIPAAGGLLYRTPGAALVVAADPPAKAKPASDDGGAAARKALEQVAAQPDSAIARLFKHRIAVQTGLTEFNEGCRIEITEVWGTRPQIEVGGGYLVRGKVTMPSRDRGRLYFFLTATTKENAEGPILDLQWTEVKKGTSEFALIHNMMGPGYFHLHLVRDDRYETLANVYFGTGDNVWRKKP